MNVENAHGKLADEVAAENTHVARQADQTNIVVAKFGHKLAVVDLAVQTFRRQNHSVEATLESQGDAGSLGPVRDDDRDLCVEASGGDGIGDGGEVWSAAGEEDSETPVH